MTLPEIAEPTAIAAALADAGPEADPFARFTDHQWYCHQARQTVYFAACSAEALDREALTVLAADIARNIPELGALYTALNGRALTREALEDVVSSQEVDDLDVYPDAWDMSGKDIFTRNDLPMLRLRAAVRRGGPDANGRRSVLSVLSTHALFEGADSALLSRSQATSHTALAAPQVRHSALRRWRDRLVSAVLGPAQLLTALLIAPRHVDIACRSLVFDRERIRRVSAALGLRQRSLMFALACFALNDGGKGFSRRRISAIYASMDMRTRAGFDGAYFRHWMTEAGFRVSDDFLTFAKTVEAEIDRLEQTDQRLTHGLLGAVFAAHRRMRRWLPFLYSDRIFRFAGFYHVNLSVTPPHRLQGPMAANMMEPLFAGSFHPGLNMCIFVPGRSHVTFNFAVHDRHLGRIAAIPALLDALER